MTLPILCKTAHGRCGSKLWPHTPAEAPENLARPILPNGSLTKMPCFRLTKELEAAKLKYQLAMERHEGELTDLHLA